MPSLSYAAQCAKIQSGSITDVNGNPITVGYDKYGYNYQAHIFNGLSENFSRPPEVVTVGTENLVMKWSDDWLANVDCNDDHKLDRGLNSKTGTSTGTSMGWVTNHYEGDYLADPTLLYNGTLIFPGGDGELHHYTYFAKIVYDAGAACSSGSSSCIWTLYTIVEEIQNDPYGMYGARLQYVNKLTGPGLGRQ
ncbi:MAG: hypothetical protein NTY86_05470 [Deltaproteobacteria bacterium]|nr:hypothetical protein [Deltaproteobacteria bacterium]